MMKMEEKLYHVTFSCVGERGSSSARGVLLTMGWAGWGLDGVGLFGEEEA